MINNDMRSYNYYTIGAKDAYGQELVSAEPVGKIKIAINTLSQSIGDNVSYKEANYIGLTQAKVKDTYVIDYEGEKLKVLYINTKGRYTQVFLKNI